MPVIPSPGWVLVKTKAVGICGSEIHAFDGTHPFRKPPAVLGHEMAGVVAETGGNAKKYKPGDRVAVDPQWVCGECRFCKSGDLNLCSSKRFLGTQEWPGGFGEYVAVAEGSLFHLPESLTFAEGAALEALSVAVHIAARVNLQPDHSVAVLGAGSIGGLYSAVAAAGGAGPVIIADIRQHCLDRGLRRLGANHAFLLPDDTFADNVIEISGGDGVDIVAICADDPALLQLALKIVRKRGKIAIVAFMPAEQFAFQAFDIIRKEVSFIGTYSANLEDYRRSIEMAANNRIDLAGIITHELPIEQVQHGFHLSKTKEDGAIKVIMTFSGD